MGIESDQVVYEYLSRVGDVAQQRQLPSSARMRLVSELRNEIDRRRAKAPVDSPAAVRRIIARLGSPDEVVAAAGDGTDGAPQAPDASVPVQREPDGKDRRGGLRRVVPRPRPAAPPSAAPSDVPSPPHLASAQELGRSATQPDWWRVEGSPFGGDDGVPGFVGGVEIPELLKPPPPKEKEAEKEAGKPVAGEPAPVTEKAEEAEVAAPRRRLPRLRPDGGRHNPLLLLAAALLVAGAVAGNLVPLGLGWLIAYLSRRLTPAEAKWAVLGLPGAVAAAGIVWLWGRVDGRWGDPIAQGHMNDAVAETWPWVLRGAAVASALFLVWRARRPRG
ncbi:hypothetical protein [Streptomyces sp. S.PNR 29]|uniref:hypothetical protein n=1 Tax=Streptomyces sp. S.PNR 29 TaxID=2973805 RepID=UPI0025AF41CF|nr:hypothetical protein [Streptomyces sp. S.PNR 29]MDN0194152.1 hypothetical protein [Streptomyces sp. S.PNR 29]